MSLKAASTHGLVVSTLHQRAAASQSTSRVMLIVFMPPLCDWASRLCPAERQAAGAWRCSCHDRTVSPIPLPSAGHSMNDLIPIAFFVGCLLATFGLVRVCEWLRPVGQSQRHEQPGSRDVVAQHRAGGENGQ